MILIFTGLTLKKELQSMVVHPSRLLLKMELLLEQVVSF